MRMRGYHSVNHREAGYEKGQLPTSYYYVPSDALTTMHQYGPLHGAFFNREFPQSWRDIDASIGNIPVKGERGVVVDEGLAAERLDQEADMEMER